LAPHGVLTEHYANPEERERLVRSLFDRSATDYDRLSRLLSFGTDRWYRRQVMRRLGVTAATRHLDVATGTGLVAQAALQEGGAPSHLVGLDPSTGMLSAHAGRHLVNLIQGRGEHLPFAADTFDLLTMGYALRHVADLRRMFAEFFRVLRPGGQVAILEITRPKSSALRGFLRFYFATVVPLLLGRTGRQRSGRLMAYYWSTINECVPPATIVQAMAEVGFADVAVKSTGPLLTDFLARKPLNPSPGGSGFETRNRSPESLPRAPAVAAGRRP
jgi:demethylmenaquinone methyltransferase/2-methoxy-6-polyprenyl-1,4-benzoquinol methylase